MKKLFIPLFALPVILSPFVGNTLGVTNTPTVSGETKIVTKVPRVSQTQLTRTQLLRKLAVTLEEMKNLKQKIKIVKLRIERKVRTNMAHTLDDASLENLLKQYEAAEKTASDIKKKLEDTASGALQKIR